MKIPVFLSFFSDQSLKIIGNIINVAIIIYYLSLSPFFFEWNTRLHFVRVSLKAISWTWLHQSVSHSFGVQNMLDRMFSFFFNLYAKEDWEKSLSIHWINTSSLFFASFHVFNICISAQWKTKGVVASDIEYIYFLLYGFHLSLSSFFFFF